MLTVSWLELLTDGVLPVVHTPEPDPTPHLNCTRLTLEKSLPLTVKVCEEPSAVIDVGLTLLTDGTASPRLLSIDQPVGRLPSQSTCHHVNPLAEVGPPTMTPLAPTGPSARMLQPVPAQDLMLVTEVTSTRFPTARAQRGVVDPQNSHRLTMRPSLIRLALFIGASPGESSLRPSGSAGGRIIEMRRRAPSTTSRHGASFLNLET
jgi:hypothetical protein